MNFKWIKDAAAKVGNVLRDVAEIPREAADRINQVHVDNQERIKKVSKAVGSAVHSVGDAIKPGQYGMNALATEYPQVVLSNRRAEDGSWIPDRDLTESIGLMSDAYDETLGPVMDPVLESVGDYINEHPWTWSRNYKWKKDDYGDIIGIEPRPRATPDDKNWEESYDRVKHHQRVTGLGTVGAIAAGAYAALNPGAALYSVLGGLGGKSLGDGLLTDDYGTYGETKIYKNNNKGKLATIPNKSRAERRAAFFAPKDSWGRVHEGDLLSPYNPAVFLSDPVMLAGAALGPWAFGKAMPALLNNTVAGRGVDLYWRAMAPKYTYDAGKDLVTDVKEGNWGDAAGDAFWTGLNAMMLPGTIQTGIKGIKGITNGAKTLKNLPKGSKTGYLKDQAKNAVDAATKDTWVRTFVEESPKAWKQNGREILTEYYQPVMHTYNKH